MTNIVSTTRFVHMQTVQILRLSKDLLLSLKCKPSNTRSVASLQISRSSKCCYWAMVRVKWFDWNLEERVLAELRVSVTLPFNNTPMQGAVSVLCISVPLDMHAWPERLP